MESQSMRRRQTVLGEQLYASGTSSATTLSRPPALANTLAVPNGGLNAGLNGQQLQAQQGRAHHMRSFSRMNARPIPEEAASTIGDASSVRSVGMGGDDDEFDMQLVSAHVDPQKYLERALTGENAASVLKFGDKLRLQAQKAQEQERYNLQHNHKALTTVANSIAQLAPAVADLRQKLDDLSIVSDAMRQDALAAQTGMTLSQARRQSASQNRYVDGDSDDTQDNEEEVPISAKDNRQSIMVLRSAWAQDLNDLYRRVNGAQRVLPQAPGRHLVLEEQGWLEVNLATRKAIKPVLLVILSDNFLLAQAKNGRYTYECHQSLEEPLEVNIDEANKVLTVAQVGLLAPSLARLRAVYSELCKLNELACSNKSRSNRPISKVSTKRAERKHKRQISHSSQKSVQEFSLDQRREAGRVLAEIDRLIAHRNWSEASRQCLEYTNDPIVGHVVLNRTKQLTDKLLKELASPNTRTGVEIGDLVKLLCRLGRAHEAKRTLLEAASRDIEEQARQVHFMGDVIIYISQMAAIYFQTIIATVTIYREAFDSKEDSSFVVSWTKTQVDLYAAIFNRQLYRIEPRFQAYKRCREVSRLESSQLRELKLDMDFMLRYAWES